MSWTPEEKELALKLWNEERMSALQIAEVINEQRPSAGVWVSRNAVIGVVTRAREHAPPGSMEPARRKQRGLPHKRAKKAQAGMIETKVQGQTESDEFGPVDRVASAQHLIRAVGQRDVPFGSSGCRWPGWSADFKSGTQCGLDQLKFLNRDDNQVTSPYCEAHDAAAHKGSAVRRRR